MRGYTVTLTDAEYDAMKARIAYLESALRIIAEGTICPDLFPLDTDENVIAAKTARVTAIAALEHSELETKGQHVSLNTACPCKGHPFHCFNHPTDCGCTSETPAESHAFIGDGGEPCVYCGQPYQHRVHDFRPSASKTVAEPNEHGLINDWEGD